MYCLKNLQWKKLIQQNLLPEHKLKIYYMDSNDKLQCKIFVNLEDIYLYNIKEVIKASVGYGKAWKNVTNIVNNNLAKMSESEGSKHHLEPNDIPKSRLQPNDIPKSRLQPNDIPKSSLQPNDMIEPKIDMYSITSLTNEDLTNIYKNIEDFAKLWKKYNNILFVCGDYPGYGGAATNCDRLQTFFKERGHNTFAFYYNNDKSVLSKTQDIWIQEKSQIKNIPFVPDLIITKSFFNSLNLKDFFHVPVIYCVGGIFANSLDKYFYDLSDDKIKNACNKNVIQQIKNSDYVFVNSSHTHDILKDNFNLHSHIFYSSFIQYYNENKMPLKDSSFEERKYEYGLIMSDFNRPIKNAQESIDFLKDKKNVILIGKNSSQYKKYGFTCIELVKNVEMDKYYRQIKYIIQDSFYESCSNVRIEGLYNGCKIHFKYDLINDLMTISKKKKTIIFISFTRWNSGILRGYNIANNLILQNNFNIEYVMYEPKKHKALFKYIKNSIIVFIKGNLKKLEDFKELFGENNYFIHDILDTYGDNNETFEDIKKYESWYNLILVNSEYMKTIFIDNGISKNKIKVLYHPCDSKLKLINKIDNNVNYIGNVNKCDIDLKDIDVVHKEFSNRMNRSIHFTYVNKDNTFSHFHTSTKLATCIKLKSIFISNKIPIFVELLGDNYPFFINNIELLKPTSNNAFEILINDEKYQLFYNKYYKHLEPILLDNTDIYHQLFNSINIPQFNSKVCFKAYFIDNPLYDTECFKINNNNIIDTYDYFIYTNSKRSFLDFLPYKKVYHDIKTKNKCRIFSRYVKWGPHILFNTYAYSIYMDSYFNIIDENEKKYNNIFTLLDKNDNILVDKHKNRKNIIEEITHLKNIYYQNEKKIKENLYNINCLLQYYYKLELDTKKQINERPLTQNGIIFTKIQNNENEQNNFKYLVYLISKFTYRDQSILQIVRNPQIYKGLQQLFSPTWSQRVEIEKKSKF